MLQAVTCALHVFVTYNLCYILLHIVTCVTDLLQVPRGGIKLLHITSRVLLQETMLQLMLHICLHVEIATYCYRFVTYVTCKKAPLHIVTCSKLGFVTC